MKQTRAENGGRKRGEERAKPRRSRWPLLVVLAVLVIGAVLAGLYCWQMWWRFDDEADIRGEWKVEATGDTIVFDGRNLKLTKSISYEYRLDESAKTIVYAFGEAEGGGHYYFSEDRSTLAILDGEETWGLSAQLGFLPEQALAADTATDNLTVLTKVSDNTEAEPSSNASGTSSGRAGGEREFVVKPETSSSSSSGRRSSSSSSSSRSDDDEDSSSSSRSTVRDDREGADDEDDGYGGSSLRRSDAAEGTAEEAGYDDEDAGYDDEDPAGEVADGESPDDEAEYGEDEDGYADEGDPDAGSAGPAEDGQRGASGEYYGSE